MNEPHMQAAEQDDAGIEEAGGKDGVRLSFRERPPGPRGSLRCGVDARVLDLPHGRRRDLVGQAGHLAMDAPVAPSPGCLGPPPGPAPVRPGRPRADRERGAGRSSPWRRYQRTATEFSSGGTWKPAKTEASPTRSQQRSPAIEIANATVPLRAIAGCSPFTCGLSHRHNAYRPAENHGAPSSQRRRRT